MTTMNVSLCDLVKETTTNMSVIIAAEKVVMEREALAAQKISQKIHKLIKKRSSLLGMANSEEQVICLTKRINSLRNKLR